MQPSGNAVWKRTRNNVDNDDDGDADGDNDYVERLMLS